MTALTREDWIIVAVGLAIALAAAVLEAWQQRSAARSLRIRAEEAAAWADEHQREAAVLAGELDRLRERHAMLTELYGEAVRRLLASNYVVIQRNIEWKRRDKQ